MSENNINQEAIVKAVLESMEKVSKEKEERERIEREIEKQKMEAAEKAALERQVVQKAIEFNEQEASDCIFSVVRKIIFLLVFWIPVIAIGDRTMETIVENIMIWGMIIFLIIVVIFLFKCMGLLGIGVFLIGGAFIFGAIEKVSNTNVVLAENINKGIYILIFAYNFYIVISMIYKIIKRSRLRAENKELSVKLTSM